jgi:cytochrome c oxidase subunit 2
MNPEPATLVPRAFTLFPNAASSIAGHTDALFGAMLLLCGGMALLIAVLIAWFCVRYRRGAAVDRSDPPSNARGLEIAWVVAPVLIFCGIFAWAAHDYLALRAPPAGALQVHVVGKQWMWKLQHGNGRREINTLHVPLNQPVELVMASEDVIHSFYVPAFRLKQDLVPGRYTRFWFTATQLGEFRLFCAEYCGSEHAAMVGSVTVMTPADYARWLQAGPAEPGLVQQGFALFRSAGCSGCHAAGSTVRAPPLLGLGPGPGSALGGRQVHLQDGRTVTADDNYLRDAILQPSKDVVAGYAPVMPSYAGQFDESQLQALLAYLRAGAPPDPDTDAGTGPRAGPGTGPATAPSPVAETPR